MSGFIDELMQSFGPEISKQLHNNLGLNTKTAQQLIPQVAPLILSGLRKQKDEFGGEARVDHILNKYGSASVLNNIGELFADKSQDDSPDPKLGGLLGDSGVQAADLLSKQFNISGDTAAKIIPMLAPVILGALTQKRDSGAGSGGIASLLDQDGDGSILDDVASFMIQGLGSSSRSGSGNVLGGLLGGLFGKKR